MDRSELSHTNLTASSKQTAQNIGISMIGVIGVLWLIGMEKECEEVINIKISFSVYMLVEKGWVGGGHTPTFSPR